MGYERCADGAESIHAVWVGERPSGSSTGKFVSRYAYKLCMPINVIMYVYFFEKGIDISDIMHHIYSYVCVSFERYGART
jgi:hypothetical protein